MRGRGMPVPGKEAKQANFGVYYLSHLLNDSVSAETGSEDTSIVVVLIYLNNKVLFLVFVQELKNRPSFLANSASIHAVAEI